MGRRVALGLTLCAGAACAPTAIRTPALDLARVDLVDLTHPLSTKTLFWPTSPSGFELKQLSAGKTPGGWYYSAYTFSAPEHGGTHIDAPVHFSETGLSTDKIPLAALIAPAVVIDVSAQAKADRDYRLTPGDIATFESASGRIPAGSIVLLRTGWDSRYGDRLAYFGDSTMGRADSLHFPGFGAEAARVLVDERTVGGLGIDSPSVDYGPSADFQVHRIGAAKNVFNLENLTGLEKLPATGAYLFALPMKLEGGSGGPVRAVAIVPKAVGSLATPPVETASNSTSPKR
ncbi:MAG TPA: cyclase family protein [Gemmatimonadaceae bacterium]|nr:cyclase family protein [Gemmatimonadaceae bacterium]